MGLVCQYQDERERDMCLPLRALVRTSRRVKEVIPEISNKGPVLYVSVRLYLYLSRRY